MSLLNRIQKLVPEASKFLTVGAVAYLVDFGVFNLLRFAGDFAPLSGKPLTAKVISAFLATLVAYFGNKNWTYAARKGQDKRKEIIWFFGLNIVAMVIAVGCLWISHYVLGLDSALADNISANIIGVAFGTLFRFFTYRRFVFIH
ncbi:MAG: GtrA family protein [Actinobacteria bacterium]|nr:GtrA family protein [Actinomycetota bacterium]